MIDKNTEKTSRSSQDSRDSKPTLFDWECGQSQPHGENYFHILQYYLIEIGKNTPGYLESPSGITSPSNAPCWTYSTLYTLLVAKRWWLDEHGTAEKVLISGGRRVTMPKSGSKILHNITFTLSASRAATSGSRPPKLSTTSRTTYS